jgi:hypothetical protein
MDLGEPGDKAGLEVLRELRRWPVRAAVNELLPNDA